MDMAFEQDQSQPPASFGKCILLSMGVCLIFTGYSVLFALANNYDRWGITIAVALLFSCYVYGAYRVFGSTTRTSRIRRALRIAYFTRLVLVIVVPIGVALDILGGTFAISIAQSFIGRGKGLAPTLVVAFIDAVMQHAFLFAYAAVVYAFLPQSPPDPTKNVCPTCGYDLRASPVRCPECGTPRRKTAEYDGSAVVPTTQ